jgi:D-alanyl-D-alanine carboxypeptidase
LTGLCLEKSVFPAGWENTNQMLGVGWSGIKTGVTPNAGPCLAASLAITLSGREYEFLVVLLHS